MVFLLGPVVGPRFCVPGDSFILPFLGLVFFFFFFFFFFFYLGASLGSLLFQLRVRVWGDGGPLTLPGAFRCVVEPLGC